MHDEIKDLKNRLFESDQLNKKMLLMFANEIDKMGSGESNYETFDCF